MFTTFKYKLFKLLFRIQYLNSLNSLMFHIYSANIKKQKYLAFTF